jgi:preprotein translocase subunit SecE
MQARSADTERNERGTDASRRRRRKVRGSRSRETRGGPASPDRKRRTSIAQFLREVRLELRRVNWPSRREVASYSLVVLVAVSLLMVYVALLDQAFGQFVLWVFG